MADATTPVPVTDRPLLPKGYGVPTTTRGLLAWSDVEPRLVAALHYWLATVRPDGTPHVVPRWGVWLDGQFWYDGAPTTRHARNLAVNPACSLNLETGAEAVIVEGTSMPTRAATSAPAPPRGRHEGGAAQRVPPAARANRET